MNLSTFFLYKISKLKVKITKCTYKNLESKNVFSGNLLTVGLRPTTTRIEKSFLYKSLIILKSAQRTKGRLRSLGRGHNTLTLFSTFLLNFLEFFFKNNIIFNIKKGSNKILIKQVGFRKFYFKYFKRNLKTSRQIVGVLYYTLLLKDSSMFVNFFRKILESINIKLHKKLFSGLKKLFKDVFKPIFNFLGVLGVFFNIRGKIGVSGSAKKRRYFFYFGKHSLTSRYMKTDVKFVPI